MKTYRPVVLLCILSILFSCGTDKEEGSIFDSASNNPDGGNSSVDNSAPPTPTTPPTPSTPNVSPTPIASPTSTPEPTTTDVPQPKAVLENVAQNRNTTTISNWLVEAKLIDTPTNYPLGNVSVELKIDGNAFITKNSPPYNWRRSDNNSLGKLREGEHTVELNTLVNGKVTHSATMTLDIKPYTANQHPFLIHRGGEAFYQNMRAKIDKNPWKFMANAAVKRWDNLPPDDIASNFNRFRDFASLYSYNMIAYMMEDKPSNRSKYVNKVGELIEFWDSHALKEIGFTGHAAEVDSATALFNTILALDLMYNDFSRSRRQELERTVEQVVERYRYMRRARNAQKQDIADYQRISTSGIIVLWALYKGDTQLFEKFYYGGKDTFTLSVRDRKNVEVSTIENFTSNIRGYRNHVFGDFIFDDGSWSQSSGYYFARMLGNRMAKSHTIDVLSATGIDNHYRSGIMYKSIEWSATCARTPFSSPTLFGDTLLYTGRTEDQNTFFNKIHQYGSQSLTDMMAWHTSGWPSSFGADNYVRFILDDEYTGNKEIPKSKLYPRSGACLWLKDNSINGLQGVLLSYAEKGGHDHDNTNSISLVGFGEHLLVNSGVEYKNHKRNGEITSGYPGNTPDFKSWAHSSLQNVVLIGDNEVHKKRFGEGLTHGLTGGHIEYGRTSAGDALGNGKHFRSLLLAHPHEDKTGGYFVIVDEISPDKKNDTVNILLQPNSQQKSVVAAKNKEHYVATIDALLQQDKHGDKAPADSSLVANIYYGTSPQTVEIETSFKGGTGKIVKTAALKSAYKADENGWVRSLIAVVPENANKPAPTVTRLDTALGKGIKVNHGAGIIDNILISDGESKFHIQDETLTYKALVASVRKEHNEIISYFVEIGDQLLNESLQNSSYGFTSSKNISVSMNQNTGVIEVIEDNTNLCLYQNAIRAIQLNNVELTATSKGDGYVCSEVHTGKYNIAAVF
ncbi:hypothetical protein [Agarilytica rhodophyticola]|uniref:hypothetical protein n=1 Tax=Agarilytica rhodophyticola TaxID=1737490 RepID=UPI000B345523|nr:hypothetical protein [Agarilytica rhodophyticola]